MLVPPSCAQSRPTSGNTKRDRAPDAALQAALSEARADEYVAAFVREGVDLATARLMSEKDFRDTLGLNVGAAKRLFVVLRQQQ